MLLNENPCKGCETIYACKEKGTGTTICWKKMEYNAQRELLGKVVEWLEGYHSGGFTNINTGKTQISFWIPEDDWQELKKELQG